MIRTLVATRTVTNYIGHNLECVNIPLTRGVIRFTKIDKLTNLSSGSLKWYQNFHPNCLNKNQNLLMKTVGIVTQGSE